MVKVFGGLAFESLVREDEHFGLQHDLYEKGLIQGVQLRVAHPCFTSGVPADDLSKILEKWPGEIFVHVGGENVGVDFGGNFDELGVYASKGRAAGLSWQVWNQETFFWASAVAEAISPGKRASLLCSVVVHPGYGAGPYDRLSFEKIASFLRGRNLMVENVPPMVFVGGKPVACWGFGGTPAGMRELLLELETAFFLVDFTHMVVAANQMVLLSPFRFSSFEKLLERVICEYLRLDPALICHFSGVPPVEELEDNHDFLHRFNPAVRDGLRKMGIICLEIPFVGETAAREIENFRENYGIF